VSTSLDQTSSYRRCPRIKEATRFHVSHQAVGCQVKSARHILYFVSALLLLAGFVALGVRSFQQHRTAELMQACVDGQVPRVRGLLAAGADANSRNADGEPVLMLAAERSEARVVRLLLNAGADVNGRRTLDGSSVLNQSLVFAADRPGKVLGVVRLLLNRGAIVDKRARAWAVNWRKNLPYWRRSLGFFTTTQASASPAVADPDDEVGTRLPEDLLQDMRSLIRLLESRARS
jgi:ankyrin repeat protein